MNTEEAAATNLNRTRNAYQAVVSYLVGRDPDEARAYEESDHAEQEWLNDLLADLRHWAEEHGLHFDEAVRISAYHFEAERAAAEADKDTGD